MDTNTLEAEQRTKTTCIACGEDKSLGCIVCWNCFKYIDNPFKESQLSLKEWLKEIA
jgi:hypothetical protein